MKGIDKFAFLLIVVSGLFTYFFGDDRDGFDDRRPSPERFEVVPDRPSGPRRPLPDQSDRDPVFVVAPSQKSDSTGTAFSVNDSGFWLTAKHVTHGCDRIALVRPDRKLVRVVDVIEHPRADVSVIRTSGGVASLGLRAGNLEIGEDGYMFGFPQGRPGDVHAQLMGRARSVTRQGRMNSEPVIAWTEMRRMPDLSGSLGGLSGGPVVDATGQIVGVVSSESARRGRVMTAAPVSVREVLQLARTTARPETAIRPGPETFGIIGDRLRQTQIVAQVYCDVL